MVTGQGRFITAADGFCTVIFILMVFSKWRYLRSLKINMFSASKDPGAPKKSREILYLRFLVVFSCIQDDLRKQVLHCGTGASKKFFLRGNIISP